LAQYDHKKDMYFWADEWHPRTDILEVYKVSDDQNDEEIRKMLRSAYRGYYLPTSPLDEVSVERWLNQYRADRGLPNSVVALYYCERFPARTLMRG